jgi:hypothetical protein
VDQFDGRANGRAAEKEKELEDEVMVERVDSKSN